MNENYGIRVLEKLDVFCHRDLSEAIHLIRDRVYTVVVVIPYMGLTLLEDVGTFLFEWPKWENLRDHRSESRVAGALHGSSNRRNEISEVIEPETGVDDAAYYWYNLNLQF
ncbi:hypothetical protein Tco_0245603 [Tanacetum coccineum]